MKHLKVFLLLIWICTHLHAANTDSLLSVIDNATNIEKLEAYDELCLVYYYTDIDSALLFAQQKLALAEQINNAEHIALAYKHIGNTYNINGDLPKAKHYYQKALVIVNANSLEEMKGTILSNIGTLFEYNGLLDSAMFFYKQAYTIDSAINNIKGQGNSIPNIGNIYLKKGLYAEAIVLFSKSLPIAKEYNDYIGLISAYNNLGLCYSKISDYQKASENYFQALELTRENNDNYYSTYMLVNLGTLYMDWENYDDALNYYIEAKTLCKASNNSETLVETLINIGAVYIKIEQPDSAIFYLNKALHITDNENFRYQHVSTLMNLGDVYLTINNYNTSKNYYVAALKEAQELELQNEIASIYYHLAKIEHVTGNYQKSIEYLNRIQNIAVEPTIQLEVFLLYTDNYEKKGNTLQALNYFKKYATLNDSAFTADKHKHIQDLSIKYETEKKEQQIKTLETNAELQALTNQKTRLMAILLSSVLLAFIVIGIFVSRQRKIQSDAQMAKTEQRYLRLQMNPHFIFNALSAIQHYVITKDALTAGSYLSRFAKLMRSILNSSRNEFISLNEEITILTDYLELQKLRLSNELSYSIDTDTSIVQEETLVPAMLAQPFIENAVEHGILKKDDKKGHIDVKYHIENKNLLVRISDNGIGRKKAGELADRNHISMATTITEERLKLLGKDFKGAHIQIEDMYTDNKPSGTAIVIKLPLILS